MPESSGPAPNNITLYLNGQPVTVTRGAMVSAALLTADVPCRLSRTGDPRTAVCGMGICYECRAVIDGVPHQRTCQIPCRSGMRVETQP